MLVLRIWWWIKIISPSWWVWTSHFPYILLPVPSPSFVVSPSFCEIVRYVMLRKCFFQLTSLCNLFSGDNLIVGSYDRRLCWFDMDLSTKPYRTLRLVWNKQFWLRKEGGDLTEVFTSSNAKQPNWLFKLLSIRVTKIVDWMLIGREIYSCDERDRWHRSALRRLKARSNGHNICCEPMLRPFDHPSQQCCDNISFVLEMLWGCCGRLTGHGHNKCCENVVTVWSGLKLSSSAQDRPYSRECGGNQVYSLRWLFFIIFRSHKKALRQVTFHRHYPLFASASDDGTVIVCHGRIFK